MSTIHSPKYLIITGLTIIYLAAYTIKSLWIYCRVVSASARCCCRLRGSDDDFQGRGKFLAGRALNVLDSLGPLLILSLFCWITRSRLQSPSLI